MTVQLFLPWWSGGRTIASCARDHFQRCHILETGYLTMLWKSSSVPWRNDYSCWVSSASVGIVAVTRQLESGVSVTWLGDYWSVTRQTLGVLHCNCASHCARGLVANARLRMWGRLWFNLYIPSGQGPGPERIPSSSRSPMRTQIRGLGSDQRTNY